MSNRTIYDLRIYHNMVNKKGKKKEILKEARTVVTSKYTAVLYFFYKE